MLKKRPILQSSQSVLNLQGSIVESTAVRQEAESVEAFLSANKRRKSTPGSAR
jgi:hypothetical protein